MNIKKYIIFVDILGANHLHIERVQQHFYFVRGCRLNFTDLSLLKRCQFYKDVKVFVNGRHSDAKVIGKSSE